jgi:hypothetical protein
MHLILRFNKLVFSLILLLFGYNHVDAQPVYEWQLTNPTFNSTDPDGAGPATGSASFTLQIRLASGTGAVLTGISTGFSWQSAAAAIPTTPGCATVSTPANVVLSSAFSAAGFLYNSVNQCISRTDNAGGQAFDRTAAGTLESTTGLNIGSTFTDVYTVTLWTLGTGTTAGGYVMINSGSGGNPGAFGTYAASDAEANEYVINSLSYTTPVALGPSTPTNLDDFSRTGLAVKLYPVPANNLLNVVIKSDKSANTTLQVFDAAGRMVRNQRVTVYTGTNNFNFDMHDLPAGEYFIRSTDKAINLTKKFTVVH